MEPFVDKHRDEFIRRVTVVDPILEDIKDLLPTEYYEYIRSRPTSWEKMEVLFAYVWCWSAGDKEILYNSLKKHNEQIIRYLEDKARDMETFVDRHREELIRRVTVVDPILDDMRHLLTIEYYEYIRNRPTSQEKMEVLFGYLRGWSDGDKEILYKSLIKHNELIIRDLEDKERGKRFPEFFQKDIITPGEVQQKRKIVSFRHRNSECMLCGKAPHCATLVAPEKIENMYRLKITTSGTVCCSETRLAFVVSGAVTIDYNLEPWNKYLKEIQMREYEIIGALFNINADDSTMVEEVHLPHYLCLKALTEEASQVRCAHFSHGNLTLQIPDRIEPFYVAIKNPTFSLLGTLFQFIEKKIPLHGIVLIYFKRFFVEDPEYREYKIHLYFVADTLQTEKVLDDRKSHYGFRRLEKPPQTIQTVYGKTEYCVHTNQAASVVPEVLRLHTNCQSDNIPFTEIVFTGNVEDIDLCVSQQNNRKLVWHTKITRGDVHEHMLGNRILSPQNRDVYELMFGNRSLSPQTSDHFVIRHRQALIERVALVDPILDELKSRNILSDEDYDTVRRSGQTSQMKMRELFEFVRSWGTREMDAFHEALRECNGPLLTDLEQTSSRELND